MDLSISTIIDPPVTSPLINQELEDHAEAYATFGSPAMAAAKADRGLGITASAIRGFMRDPVFRGRVRALAQEKREATRAARQCMQDIAVGVLIDTMSCPDRRLAYKAASDVLHGTGYFSTDVKITPAIAAAIAAIADRMAEAISDAVPDPDIQNAISERMQKIFGELSH